MRGQKRDVLGAFAQRGQRDGEDVEEEIQVLAETPGHDLARQVAAGAGDDADIDPPLAVFADAGDGLVAQRVQQPPLKFERQVGDLFQEQRAAVRQFEPPGLVDPASVAADLPEKLAVDVVGQGGAVQPDHRAAPAVRRLVHGGGDQRLAGARLPGDQHVGIGRRHQFHLFQRPLDRGGFAHHIVMRAGRADLFLEVGVLLFQPVAQGVDLGHGVTQPPLAFLAVGDVAEDHHGTGQHLPVVDRGRDVFDLDRATVLAPEHLVLHAADTFVAERMVDRAVAVIVGRAVEVAVVDDGVGVAAQQILRRPAQHLLRGAVDEGGLSVRVDPVDAFARRIEDQLVLAFQFRKEGLGALPLHQAGAVEGARLGDVLPRLKVVERDERDQQSVAVRGADVGAVQLAGPGFA